MQIFLCGFMGSGKTTLLNRLEANNSSAEWSFYDLDHLLQQFYGQTVEEIVAEVGWAEFRFREKTLLRNVIAENKKFVMSLGGGTLTGETFEMIKGAGGGLIWLSTPFETCWERIKNDKSRPLVAKGEAELKELYELRRGVYDLASLHLSPENQDRLIKLDQILDIKENLDECIRIDT